MTRFAQLSTALALAAAALGGCTQKEQSAANSARAPLQLTEQDSYQLGGATVRELAVNGGAETIVIAEFRDGGTIAADFASIAAQQASPASLQVVEDKNGRTVFTPAADAGTRCTIAAQRMTCKQAS